MNSQRTSSREIAITLQTQNSSKQNIRGSQELNPSGDSNRPKGSGNTVEEETEGKH